MARFNAADANNYGGQGGAGFFSLKNDKDVAKVRFLYRDENDIEGFAVHEVQVDGKKRYVNCLREYGQPIQDCPMCESGSHQLAKLFIPLYNIDEQKIQTWERGKKWFAKMSSMCHRYPNLVSQVFEVERNGKAGSTDTTYELYSVGNADDTTLDDFDMPEILGGLVLDKTADDMVDYINTGAFPNTGSNAPITRRNSSDEAVTRRTPANTRRRVESDEDKF